MVENKRNSRFLLRLPQELYVQIHQKAGDDYSSMNACVVAILEQFFKEVPDSKKLDALLNHFNIEVE